MAIATVDLVLFALRAGVRLGRAARTAYVDSIRMREIALPIPNAGFTLEVMHARTFFNEEGREFVKEDDRLAALHARAVARTLPQQQGDPDHDTYLNHYLYCRSIVIARRQRSDVTLITGPAVDPDALLAMFRFQQWERDDPDRPKPLRRVLGTIIDVGVDYFASVPGAMTVDSRHQRTLTAFVRAVDRLDFEQIALDESPLSELMGRLLVAALETIGEQPEIIASDPNVRQLVSVTTTALAGDIARRLEQATTTDEGDAIRSWGELVFRSVLRSGARHVLEHPGTLLGVEDEAQQALVSRIGIATIDLVTADGGLHPERLFSGEGVQTVVSAALAAVADHPELVTDSDNAGVTALVQSIAKDLSQVSRATELALIPEIARIILSRTGEHLELIWPDLDPQKHLLLTASRVTLEVLTKKPTAGASWKPQFGREDLLTVVDAVVDEVAMNPGWLLKLSADADANLQAALGAVLQVLRKRADQRLSTSVAAEVMAAAVRAIAVRQEFLAALPNGKPFVAAVIDAIVTELFASPAESAASWALLRREFVTGAVDAALRALASSALDEAAITTVRTIYAEAVQGILNGEAVDLVGLEVRVMTAFAPAEVDA